MESHEEAVQQSGPGVELTATFFVVDVEQTLKGDAKGAVEVREAGGDSSFAEEGPASELGPTGPLLVGERYLFFAGLQSDEGWYPITAGYTNVLIRNDQQAAELVAQFVPAIVQAEQRRAEILAADPCEHPESAPVVKVDPQRGVVGTKVKVTGSDFVRPQVSMWWDGMDERLGTSEIGEECSLTASIEIPQSEIGEHRIIVTDARNERGVAVFEVIRD